MDVKEPIREYIENNLISQDDDGVELKDSDNLFQKGFVNSLFAIRLVTFIEREFHIIIDNAELDIENFNSIDNICAFIKGKTE